MLRAVVIVAAAIAVRNRAIVSQGDFILRVSTWWRLVNEYDGMKVIYDQHAADGFFVEDIEESEAAAVRGLKLRRSSKERLLSLLSPRRRAGRALLFGDRVLAV